jgi:hypothetical protein
MDKRMTTVEAIKRFAKELDRAALRPALPSETSEEVWEYIGALEKAAEASYGSVTKALSAVGAKP